MSKPYMDRAVCIVSGCVDFSSQSFHLTCLPADLEDRIQREILGAVRSAVIRERKACADAIREQAGTLLKEEGASEVEREVMVLNAVADIVEARSDT